MCNSCPFISLFPFIIPPQTKLTNQACDFHARTKNQGENFPASFKVVSYVCHSVERNDIGWEGESLVEGLVDFFQRSLLL